jgi:hypothetical protein
MIRSTSGPCDPGSPCLAYDHDAAEAKAVAGGYRIGPWMDRYYFLRRRIARRFMVRRD